MNVIFLDVDGELTYSEYHNPETDDIDIEKVKILKQIVDENNAGVVISSSWRGTEKYTPRIYHTLIKVLTDNGIKVLGDCPHLKCEFVEPIENNEITLNSVMKLHLVKGTGRAAEVESYIKIHDVDRFLILDDEDFQWSDYGFDDKWIKPTWFGNGGLKPEHIKQAKEIFDKQKRL